MKNRSFGHGSPFFFRHRLHGNDSANRLELARTDPELKRSKDVLENILRWEDDGGQMLELGNPIDRSKPELAGELASE